MALAGVVATALSDGLPSCQLDIHVRGQPDVDRGGGLANLDYLLEHDLQTNAYKVGNRLKSNLDELADRTEIIAEVRGKGLMLGIELCQARRARPRTRLRLRPSWRKPRRKAF